MKDYAYRTACYAFGIAGDINIAAAAPTPEQILEFHQEAERIEAARTGAVEEVREAPRMHRYGYFLVTLTVQGFSGERAFVCNTLKNRS